MPDPDLLYQRVADAKSPTVAGDVSGGNLFSVFDKGLDSLLALFKQVLISEMTAAWDVAKVGTKHSSAAVVADTLWLPPSKAVLTATKFDFPLLCLYRTSQTHEEHTLVEEQVTSTWGLDYILGPLELDDYRRLGGALNGALAFVKLAARNKSHPAYQTDDHQLGEGLGRFNSIRLVSSQMGPADFGESEQGVLYYALHCDLETTEIDAFVDDASTAYGGFTFHGHVGDAHQVLTDTIIAESD